MAQYKGDSRDAKRAHSGARMQEEMKEAFERKVEEMRNETNKSLNNMELSRMFSTDSSISQTKFANAIIGLQTHEQYRDKAKIYLPNHNNHGSDRTNNNSEIAKHKEIIHKIEEKSKQKQILKQNLKNKSLIQRNCLSFADESESESEEEIIKIKISKRKRKLSEETETENNKKRQRINIEMHKNPNVNTSFLPDTERDLRDEKLRNELELEWFEKQRQIKKERLEITYSYWDGSGHRRSIEITKGISIGAFLELVRKELSVHFSELRGINGDYLMYIKDDQIIPHSSLFYDLIVTHARGKSGHLMFRNTVCNKGDYVIDRDSGHPGKIITRSWYERNKHIFPASRWTLYNSAQSSDE